MSKQMKAFKTFSIYRHNGPVVTSMVCGVVDHGFESWFSQRWTLDDLPHRDFLCVKSTIQCPTLEGVGSIVRRRPKSQMF